MKDTLLPGLYESRRLSRVWLLSLLLSFTSAQTYAAGPPITASGLNTKVADPIVVNGRTQYDITGGTRPGGGPNLFHSFGDFNVPQNNVANFLNDSGLATSNILGRVTGGNISNIFGTIQTTNFPGANLFLMNPAGFLFGPNATVNVGGMVAFTSADYLRLTDGARFYAAQNATADALLSMAPVAAFGFLGSNPGAITVQGSQLSVTPGQSLSMVGGNITIQSGTPEGGTAQSTRLSAPNGSIQLASTASPGEFDAATLQPLSNVNGASFTSFGSLNLAPGANINVSGNQTASIRGGQFVLSVNDATLSTAQSPGPAGTISLSPGSSMLSSNAGPDPGADMQLIASNIQLDGASIQSLTTGNGAGGTISITATSDGGPTAGSIQMKGGQIQTASLGPGTVGDIHINSGTLSMTDGALIDTLLVPNPLIPGQPAGGTITITATDSISITGRRPGTTNLLLSVPGFPTFTNMPSGIYVENLSANTGSHIVIQAPRLTLQPGFIGALSFGGGATGNLSFHVGQLTLEEGAVIGNFTFGTGATGILQIKASDSITLSGSFPETFQLGPLALRNVGSEIVNVSLGLGQAGPVSISTSTLTMRGTNIASSVLGPGDAGDLNIQARTIIMTDGAVISGTTNFGGGGGGNVSVTASEELSISGFRTQSASFGTGTTPTLTKLQSGIGASTFGPGRAGTVTITTPRLTMFDGAYIRANTGGNGPAGSLTINAGSINVSSGALISSSSGLILGQAFLLGNGPGGTVTVNATGPITIAGQGSGISTATSGSGRAGNISLNANSLTLQDGARISSSSTGTGIAGNVTINSGNQLTMMDSSITTAANQSSGGAIKITTTPTGAVQLTDSVISASVLDGTGGGGSVNIDPQYVVLQNSQILAQAVQGPGGNINITTNLLMPDSTSLISASSEFGQQGTISIQSPVAPASGKIIPLGQKPLIETALVSQRCAAVAGGNMSSFTVAGRDTLPAEPGGLLSSPLALGVAESEAGVREGGLNMPASEVRDGVPLVYLRKIAPVGFLIHSFGVDSSGCHS